MSPSRRRAIQTSLATGAAAVAGCDGLVSELGRQLGEAVPASLLAASGRTIDPDFHLLSRATYGPRPGDLARLRRQGPKAWLEDQLHPERLDDTTCDLRAERFESLGFAPGDAYAFRRSVLRDELVRHALLRAIYSRRQLFELLVGFWSDHLNIDIGKGDCVVLKPADDREVIRRHALGRFAELIRASATSPAMLVYLDNAANKVRRGHADKPNENYARELLELHTLGVDGGYTQRDVTEAARCLTGWTFDAGRVFATDQNRAFFRADWHDDGEKLLLGHRIPAGGGPRDLDRLVEIVCRHPSTARHIAGKLCRRFVAADPPRALVESTAAVFTRTDGQIPAVLRNIFRSAEFADSRGLLLKRPLRFVVSALRAVAADTHARPPLLDALRRLGQPLFEHPTPDGYAADEATWLGTLLWRWNLAFALAGGNLPTVTAPLEAIASSLAAASGDSGDSPRAEGDKDHAFTRWFAHLIGRRPTRDEQTAFAPLLAAADQRREARQLGLILASPAFQRH